MAMLKGNTVIELKDVKTGKIDRYEHHNALTTFASDFLRRWAILGTKQANGTGAGSLQQICLPLYQKMFGGIRIYNDDISGAEYPRIDQAALTGYAGNVRSDGVDPKRGDFNSAESQVLENGYKFVWDFPTNIANGTIKSVCLTHELGGFHGDKLNPTYLLTGGNTITTNETASNYRGLSLNMSTPNSGAVSLFVSGGTGNLCPIELKWNADDNLELWFATLPDKDTLRISKRVYYFGRLKMTAGVFPSYDTVTVANINISGVAGFTSNTYIPEVFNGEDGYYYVVFGSYNGHSGYRFCKINTTTWEITTIGTSNSTNAIYNNNYYYSSNGYTRGGSSRWVSVPDYFIINYNSAVYKVSKSTFEITNLNVNSSYLNSLYMYKYGGNVILSGRYILNIVTGEVTDPGAIPTALDTGYSYGIPASGNLLKAPGAMSCMSECLFLAGNSRWYSVVACDPLYHATVNNLETAVIKTASKVMKITYTITETT